MFIFKQKQPKKRIGNNRWMRTTPTPSSTPSFAPSSSPIVFEAAFVDGLRAIFETRIEFNAVLGLKVTHLTPTLATARIGMRRELIGHYSYNRLHGGVISAALDTLGGLAVMCAIGARHMDEPPEKRLERFGKLGTIDLRIDYLRPAISDHFELRAEVLRLGSRVASTRMEFTGADGTLFSTGAAAYIVS
jgi:acyl-coenzyme A thioesterase PaaI-like protein